MTKVQTVIDRANNDPTFRGRLRADPAAAFREAGLVLPKGAAVEVIDANRGDIHLLLGGRVNVPELDRIAERAEKDTVFKERLLRDPRAAVQDHIGWTLSAKCKVHVREAKPDTMYLYLADPQNGPEELTDGALEAVSGGILQLFIGAALAGLGIGLGTAMVISDEGVKLTAPKPEDWF